MTDILIDLWDQHELLNNFIREMNKKGYVGRDLYCLQVQINLLNNLIDTESKNVLSDLLKKTYFRLLKSIDRGIEYLPDIINNSEEWVLNPIENDREAWIDKDTLIFTTKPNCAVFSKITRKDSGYKYVDNKWQ